MNQTTQETARAVLGAFIQTASDQQKEDAQLSQGVKSAHEALNLAFDALSRGDAKGARSFMVTIDRNLGDAGRRLEARQRETAQTLASLSNSYNRS